MQGTNVSPNSSRAATTADDCDRVPERRQDVSVPRVHASAASSLTAVNLPTSTCKLATSDRISRPQRAAADIFHVVEDKAVARTACVADFLSTTLPTNKRGRIELLLTRETVTLPAPRSRASVIPESAFTMTQLKEVNKSIDADVLACSSEGSVSKVSATVARPADIAETSTNLSSIKAAPGARTPTDAPSPVSALDVRLTSTAAIILKRQPSLPRSGKGCIVDRDTPTSARSILTPKSHIIREAAVSKGNTLIAAATSATLSRDATGAFEDEETVGKTTTTDLRSVSLATNDLLGEESADATVQRETTKTFTGEIQQNGRVSSAAETSLAVPTAEHRLDPLSAALKSGRSAAPVLSPLLAEGSLFAPPAFEMGLGAALRSLHCELCVASPASINLPGTQKVGCDGHLRDQSSEAFSPSFGAVSWHRSAQTSGIAGSSSTCHKTALNESALAKGLAKGAARTPNEDEDDPTAVANARSSSSVQSRLKPSAFSAASSATDKLTPLLTTSTITVNTPSTMTSANLSGSAAASFSPASCSPSLDVTAFHHSSFIPTSDISPAMQDRCGEIFPHCPLPCRSAAPGPPVNNAPSAGSSPRTAGASSASLLPYAPPFPSCTRHPPGSHLQQPISMQTAKEGHLATVTTAAAVSEKISSAGANLTVALRPLPTTIRVGAPPAFDFKRMPSAQINTASSTCGLPVGSEDRHLSATALGESCSVAAVPILQQVANIRRRVTVTSSRAAGFGEAIDLNTNKQDTERCQLASSIKTGGFAGLQGTQMLSFTRNATLRLTTCPPFPSGASDAASRPFELGFGGSVDATKLAIYRKTSDNMISTERGSADATGPQANGAGLSNAETSFDKTAVSFNMRQENTGCNQRLPSPQFAGALTGGRATSSVMKDWSAGGRGYVPRHLLAFGSNSEARGLSLHSESGWNASTVKARCLLAACLRSIFKMLIKRARRQQYQYITEGSNHILPTDTRKVITEAESNGSKRRRLNGSVATGRKQPCVSCCLAAENQVLGGNLSHAISEKRMMFDNVRGPAHATTDLHGEQIAVCNIAQKCTEAKVARNQPNVSTGGAVGQRILEGGRNAVKEEHYGPLADPERQKEAWAAAASVLQDSCAAEEAHRDSASSVAISPCSSACTFSRRVAEQSRAFSSKQRNSPVVDAETTSCTTDMLRSPHGQEGGGPGTATNHSDEMLGRSRPCVPSLESDAPRQTTSPTVPQAGGVASALGGIRTEVEAFSEEKVNAQPINKGTSRINRDICGSTNTPTALEHLREDIQVFGGRTVHNSGITSTLYPSCTAALKNHCRVLSASPASSGYECAVCTSNPCSLGRRRTCCSEESHRASSHTSATSAEQQLLSAYRECFLLLTAAERKEELYIFEFVLLGGSCSGEAASPFSKRNRASPVNGSEDGVTVDAQHSSKQSCGQPQTAELGNEILRGTPRRDAAASQLGAVSPRRRPGEGASAATCVSERQARSTGKGWRTDSTEKGFLEGVDPRAQKAIPVNAAEVMSRKRKKIALQPENWDANKIHYVLAALDGLRDAWRQGSNSTRAKARILESMLPALSQGAQQRLVQLPQRPYAESTLEQAQQQKFVQLPPLQKVIDTHPTAAPNPCTPALSSSERGLIKVAPISPAHDTKKSGMFSNTGRGLPTSAVLRPCTFLQTKQWRRADAADVRSDDGSSSGETGCGEQSTDAFSCARLQHCGHLLSQGGCTSRSWPCAAYAQYPARSHDHDACECSQENMMGVPVNCECEKDVRIRATTLRPWVSQARRVQPALGVAAEQLEPNAGSDLLTEKSDKIHPKGTASHTPEQQSGHCLQQRDSAPNSNSSIVSVNTSRTSEKNNILDANGSAAETSQQHERAEVEHAGACCSERTRLSKAEPSGRSAGDGRVTGKSAKGLRRGKLRRSPPGRATVDDGKDLYRKPRPSVISRRVLLQRLKQRTQSVSRATASSGSDFDGMSNNAAFSKPQNRKAIYPAVVQIGQDNSAGCAENAEKNRFSNGGQDKKLTESPHRKLRSGCVADRCAIDRIEEHELELPTLGGKRDSVELADEIKSQRKRPVLDDFSSWRPPSEEILFKVGEQAAQLFSKGVEGVSDPQTAATAASMTYVKRDSCAFPSAVSDIQTGQTLVNIAGATESNFTATQQDGMLAVESCHDLPSTAPESRSVRQPTCPFVSQPRLSLVSNAQPQVNVIGGVINSSFDNVEEPLRRAAEGAPQSTASAGSTINSQQQTAAMRTTRHNKTKQPGVFQFTRGPKRFWAASWYADGHPGWKAFSVEKWGNSEAFERARRAYEEKVPRSYREQATASGVPEMPSSVRVPCRPWSPHAYRPVADKALSRGLPCTKHVPPDAAQGGNCRSDSVSKAPVSGGVIKSVVELASIDSLTLPAKLGFLKNCADGIPIADSLNQLHERRGEGDSTRFVSNCAKGNTTRQYVRDERVSVQSRQEQQPDALTADEDGKSTMALPVHVHVYEPATSSTTKEKNELSNLFDPPACSAGPDASAQDHPTCRQGAEHDLTGSSPGSCSTKRHALSKTGTTLSLRCKKNSEQSKCFAEDDGLDRSRQGTLQGYWNGSERGLGTLSLSAAFTARDLPSLVYDSSSSTGFDLMVPRLSGSPHSLSQMQRPPRSPQQDELRQGLEQLLLDAAAAVSEGGKCGGVVAGGCTPNVQTDAILETQQKYTSDNKVPTGTQLTEDAYALLNSAEFLHVSSVNDDVAAHLLLAGTEDDVTKAGSTRG